MEYFGYKLGLQNPSSWIYFPTDDNPLGKYKFGSIELGVNLDLYNVSRQTYSLLDWLGDVGGLLDILLHMGSALVLPIATFNL